MRPEDEIWAAEMDYVLVCGLLVILTVTIILLG